jgi:hypothetical protein
MKSKKVIVTLLAAFFLIGDDSKAQAPYPIKSAKITYLTQDEMISGKNILIFTDSGRLEKQIDSLIFTEKHDSGISRTLLHFLSINNQDSIISINLIDKTVTVTPMKGLNFPVPDMKKIGEENVLDRRCEIFQYGGTTIWRWKGIILRQENYFPWEGTKSLRVAISIEEGYEIKPDEFDIPAGVSKR